MPMQTVHPGFRIPDLDKVSPLTRAKELTDYRSARSLDKIIVTGANSTKGTGNPKFESYFFPS